MTVVESKLRRVGTSFGILLPNEIIKQRRMKEGEKISIIIPQKKSLRLIEEAFGSVKSNIKFKRDKTDRTEKY